MVEDFEAASLVNVVLVGFSVNAIRGWLCSNLWWRFPQFTTGHLGWRQILEKCLLLVGFRQLKHNLLSWTSFHLSSTAFPLNSGQFSDPWPPLQNLQIGTAGGFASLNIADAVDTSSWSLISMNGGCLRPSLPLFVLRLFRLRFPWRFFSPASLDTTCRLRNLKNNSRSISSSGVSASSNSHFSNIAEGNLSSNIGNKIQSWLFGIYPRASKPLVLFFRVSYRSRRDGAVTTDFASIWTTDFTRDEITTRILPYLCFRHSTAGW